MHAWRTRCDYGNVSTVIVGGVGVFMLGDHVLVFSLCCGGRVAGEARLQLPMTRHMWLGCCWHGTCEYAECGDTREIMMGVGNRVASVIMLTFPSEPCPHADFSK